MKRFDVEVPSMVAKYIKGNTGDVVTASLGDRWGSDLYLMAQSSKVKLFISEKRQMEMEKVVTVQIQDYHRTRAAQLYNFAECCIIAERWRWYATYEFLSLIKKGLNPKTAINHFRDRYQIDDMDWSDDAMWQAYTRYRQGKSEFAFKPHIIVEYERFPVFEWSV